MPLFSTPSPKALAFATWRDVQRPQYIAKIEHATRKAKAQTNAESVHSEPKISNPRK